MPSTLCSHVPIHSAQGGLTGNSIILTAKRGTTSNGDDDSSAAYNRICVALQALIDEAQLAVQKDSISTTAHVPSDVKVEFQTIQDLSLSQSSPWIDGVSYNGRPSNTRLASRRSPRNSLTLLHPTKVENSSYILPSEYSPAPFYSGTDEVSKIYWRQKHEEQHDRYRKSCQRLTLELEDRFLQNGIATDSDDSEASSVLMPHLRSRTTPSALSPPSSSMPSTPTTPSRPLQGILRSSKKTGSRAERLKKKYQVQFLNPDIQQESRQHRESSTVRFQKQQRQQQQLHQQRQYTDRSVGSTRSRGVVMQLYELWQQTWLRTRIMHVITGSVEVVIIIWVVIRASRATLTWFGIQPANVQEWLTFIYGHRDSAGAKSAKDLYAAIRRDGLQLRQIKAWSRREPEALVQDLVTGAAATASTGLISPSTMVYGPAKKVMAHAVTGVALALLSDGARRLLRKL
ncbi:hypothetical protein BGX28_004174 [Mortierella sp. GBA30]|nr:hypothetical protein BGX28_004174 [Mortierella sp. GBA30]